MGMEVCEDDQRVEDSTFMVPTGDQLTQGSITMTFGLSTYVRGVWIMYTIPIL